MFNLNRCDISIRMLFYSVYKNVQEQNFGRPSTIRQNRTSLNKGSLRFPVRRARRGSEPAKQNLTEHQHRFNRCATARLRTHAHKAMLARTPAQWSRNLKHSNTFLIDSPQALEPSRAWVCSIPSTRILARNTDVYLWRFSMRKSSIEPSFSSY